MKNAFTLAEVLITIGIIGIVAAMTLPSIIPNFEKMRNLAVLKRAYSDLGQYVLDFDRENNCYGNLENCCPNSNEFAYKFTEYLITKQNFKQVKPARVFANKFDGTFSNYLGAENAWNGVDDRIGAVMISPTGLYMYYVSVNQADLYYRVGRNYFRGWIWIFTDNSKFYRTCKNCSNAEQAKARIGRNLFQAFVMQDERIIPNGSSYCTTRDSWGYHCQNWQDSMTCTAGYEQIQGTHDRGQWGCLSRIIDKGWTIDYY